MLGDCAITRGEQLAMVKCQDVVSERVISDQLSTSHLLGHGSQIIWWWIIPLPFAPDMRCWQSPQFLHVETAPYLAEVLSWANTYTIIRPLRTYPFFNTQFAIIQLPYKTRKIRPGQLQQQNGFCPQSATRMMQWSVRGGIKPRTQRASDPKFHTTSTRTIIISRRGPTHLLTSSSSLILVCAFRADVVHQVASTLQQR